MNCRDEVTNRDLQDSYLTLCLARESRITKSLSLWDPTSSHMIMTVSPLLADITGQWVILVHLSDGRVVACAHAMLSLTKSPGD